MFIVKIKKLTEDCTIPQKAHIDDAAFDIYAAENIIVEPQKPTPVSTGFCMELPPHRSADPPQNRTCFEEQHYRAKHSWYR